MTTSRIIATVAFAAITILTTNANAQVQAQVIGQQGGPEQAAQVQIDTRVMPETQVVPPQPPAPKLGFMGQMVYGLGMKVLNVNYGSPAQRAGLEYGDVIISANGINIRNHQDLSRVLSEAAQYRNGSVSLFVKNVRGNAYQGNEYVTVHAQLFGQPRPAMGVAYNQTTQN
jgi:S1-C subfamily serine protease